MNNITNPPQLKIDFVENIKKWVQADSQLKLVNEKAKQLRDIKYGLTDNILDYIESNNLKTNNIGISDGELIFYEKKSQTPLSFAYIEECLENIIPDKTKIEYIIDYLKDNREVTATTDIRRVYNKK
jgi:hypothetical protein